MKTNFHMKGCALSLALKEILKEFGNGILVSQSWKGFLNLFRKTSRFNLLAAWCTVGKFENESFSKFPSSCFMMQGRLEDMDVSP